MKIMPPDREFVTRLEVSRAKQFYVTPDDDDDNIINLSLDKPDEIKDAAERLGCSPELMKMIVENQQYLVENLEEDLRDMADLILRVAKGTGLNPQQIRRIIGG